jgi:hypothetical protein
MDSELGMNQIPTVTPGSEMGLNRTVATTRPVDPILAEASETEVDLSQTVAFTPVPDPTTEEVGPELAAALDRATDQMLAEDRQMEVAFTQMVDPTGEAAMNPEDHLNSGIPEIWRPEETWHPEASQEAVVAPAMMMAPAMMVIPAMDGDALTWRWTAARILRIRRKNIHLDDRRASERRPTDAGGGRRKTVAS